ncbi:MAG: cytochrome c [Betaproteobacteria bacterium]
MPVVSMQWRCPFGFGSAFLLCGAAILLAACATHAIIEASVPPSPATVDPELVARGAPLAALGNCVTCHTAEEGKPFAGGYAVKTPFGTVYGTNITPEPDTGIGRWSLAAFERAMREGIDREGRHLYPAFPYDHFTKVTDEDIGALYAFLMTREPVRAETPANTVIVPRPLVAIWKALFFERGALRPDPARDSTWNRGAYLAQGLGHCGACHTPRNRLGAEKKDERFAGGEVEGWHAPALNAASPSPVPWTAEAMAAYLRTGIVEAHAVPAGPMVPVVRNLSQAREEDARAIAAYVVSLDTRPEAQRLQQRRAALALPPRGRMSGSDDHGAQIYAGSCADCHDRGRAEEGGALPLALAIGPALPTPANLIRITRDGIVPETHEHGLWMPAYAGALTDAQLADLMIYLRSITGLPAWRDVAGEVRKARRAAQ